MMPDDFGGVQRNVLGGPLGTCSDKPLTGFFRDALEIVGLDDLKRHAIDLN